MLPGRMRLRLLFALAFAPVAASAVTMTVNQRTQDILVGASTCRTLSLVAQWDLQQAPTANDSIELIGARSLSTCSATTVSSPDAVFQGPLKPQAQTGSFNPVTASQMVLSSPDAGVLPCDDPNVTTRTSANPLANVLCVQYQIPAGVLGGAAAIATAQVNVKFALAPPHPPVNLSIAPGDSHLQVAWAEGDPAEDIATFDVHVVPQGTVSDGGVAKNVTSTNADIQTTDNGAPLQNDAGYDVYIIANDRYGNVSPPSDIAVGFPVAVADFYNHYRGLGGSAEGGGGCTTAGASFWIAGAAVAAALFARRRRKARNGAALVAAFALLAPAARADDEKPTPRFLIGFKVDRYDPKVDSEPGLTGTPYHDVFGPKAPLRYQLEFDWEVVRPWDVGALLVGGTVGFWQNYGRGILRSSSSGQPQQSQDPTHLNVMPISLIVTYRFDWVANRYWYLPFIPYAQAGLTRALWASFSGTGDVSTDTVTGQTGRGSGWTNGYTTALGVAVNLNVISPGLAREAYLDTGIQRTTGFAEYGWTYLNNYNKGGEMILSDRAWRFGLAVEF